MGAPSVRGHAGGESTASSRASQPAGTAADTPPAGGVTAADRRWRGLRSPRSPGRPRFPRPHGRQSVLRDPSAAPRIDASRRRSPGGPEPSAGHPLDREAGWSRERVTCADTESPARAGSIITQNCPPARPIVGGIGIGPDRDAIRTQHLIGHDWIRGAVMSRGCAAMNRSPHDNTSLTTARSSRLIPGRQRRACPSAAP